MKGMIFLVLALMLLVGAARGQSLTAREDSSAASSLSPGAPGAIRYGCSVFADHQGDYTLYYQTSLPGGAIDRIWWAAGQLASGYRSHWFVSAGGRRIALQILRKAGGIVVQNSCGFENPVGFAYAVRIT